MAAGAAAAGAAAAGGAVEGFAETGVKALLDHKLWALNKSFKITEAMSFGNIFKLPKLFNLDFKANTRGAELGFDHFASRLANRFLVSGLNLSVFRSSLEEINKQFTEATQEQGLAFGSENLALQNKVSVLFALLKGGSINAAVAMKENIRKALGEISKEVGSTTEDINSTMELVPITSRRALDSIGMSMGEFSSKALKLQTNTRVALGENAVEFLNKALAGEASISDMKNDKTSIGQLINKRFGILPFTALGPEQRTKIVARMLNDDAFQKQIEVLADRTGGYERVFRKFTNSLFDAETGILGVLKEVTIKFKDFSGRTIQSTTSIFKELTLLTRAIFDVNTGLLATIAKAISEAFGFDKDTPLRAITRVIRFFRDVTIEATKFAASAGAPIFSFFKSLKSIFSILGTIGGLLWTLISKGKFTTDEVNTIQKGVSSAISALIKNIIPSLTKAISYIGNRIQDILKTIIELSQNISYDGSGLMSAIGMLITEILKQIGVIIPLGFKAISESFKSVVRNFGGYENIKQGFFTFLRELMGTLDLIIDSFHNTFIDPAFAAVASTQFIDFFAELGEIIGPTVAKLLDTVTNYLLLERLAILTAFSQLMTPELKASILNNVQILVDLFVRITMELIDLFIAELGPILWAGLRSIVGAAITALSKYPNIGPLSTVLTTIANIFGTSTSPNLPTTPTTPGSTYEDNTYPIRAEGKFFDAIQMEKTRTSPFARPVIANSEEIIIPKGRVQELNTNIETKVVAALMPSIRMLANKKNYSVQNNIVNPLKDFEDSNKTLTQNFYEITKNSFKTFSDSSRTLTQNFSENTKNSFKNFSDSSRTLTQNFSEITKASHKKTIESNQNISLKTLTNSTSNSNKAINSMKNISNKLITYAINPKPQTLKNLNPPPQNTEKGEISLIQTILKASNNLSLSSLGSLLNIITINEESNKMQKKSEFELKTIRSFIQAIFSNRRETASNTITSVPNVEVTLPEITIPEPVIQEKVVEKISEKVSQIQEKSFLDRIKDKLGFGEKEKPVNQQQQQQTSNPIQVVVKLDSKIITDVILDNIQNRAIEVMSTP